MFTRTSLLLAALCSLACGPETTEPSIVNGANTDAQAIRDIAGGGRIKGRIKVGQAQEGRTRTQDFWRLTLSQTTDLWIELNAFDDGDTYLELYKKNGPRWRKLATNDDCDDYTYDACLGKQLRRGRYLLKATSYEWVKEGSNSLTTYELAVYGNSEEEGEFETGPCGTPGGITCGPRKYCHFTIRDQCGRTNRGGKCQEKRQACTRDYRPVCGCNGRTYSNKCMANSQGASVESNGRCR